MSKIHFASLFGVDLDYDIMVHWCRHYLSMGYDTYTVFLHTIDPDGTRYKFIRHAFEIAGFSVRQAPCAAYTTQMRNDLLDAFAKSLDPLDYLVVADSDEFHLPEPWATNFRDLIMSCDCLYGTLFDRWADSLTEARPDIPLDEQYPYTGDVFKIVFDRSDDPEKDRWLVPNRNKILAARAGLPVAHQGSHVLYRPCNESRKNYGCIVEHFKWRGTIIDRIRTKWYYREGFEQAITRFFQTEGVPA